MRKNIFPILLGLLSVAIIYNAVGFVRNYRAIATADKITSPAADLPVDQDTAPRQDEPIVAPVSEPAASNSAPVAAEETETPVENTVSAVSLPAKASLSVPFTSQAPDGEWDDPRQQDGCEEASVIMAMAWAKNEKLEKNTAKNKILELADFQSAMYGGFHDTSAADTIARLFEDYYDYFQAQAVYDFSLNRIKEELAGGRLVIVPADGQKLGNPNFTAPGPERHMLVIKGYDSGRKEFITNDPGTRKGEDYRYNENVLFNAVRDYPTGDHAPITEIKKAMIIVAR